MTTRWQPTKANCRQQQLKWINILVHAHDMNCDCPNPLEHTVVLIHQQEPELKFTTIEKDIIKKCLGGGETTVTAGDHEEDHFGDGDLAELFKEDFGEDATTG